VEDIKQDVRDDEHGVEDDEQGVTILVGTPIFSFLSFLYFSHDL